MGLRNEGSTLDGIVKHDSIDKGVTDKEKRQPCSCPCFDELTKKDEIRAYLLAQASPLCGGLRNTDPYLICAGGYILLLSFAVGVGAPARRIGGGLSNCGII